MLDPILPHGDRRRQPPDADANSPEIPCPGFLTHLGLHGLVALELPLLLHLILGTPLLLVGDRGSAKSRLMESLYRALGLVIGSINLAMASQLEDLAGWPSAKALAEGRWEWQDAPHTVWRKQALFMDELARVTITLQGKLFDLLRDRKVMGTPIEGLELVSAACNRPGPGSQPLDPALLGRFGVTVEVPNVADMDRQDRLAVIRSVGESDAPLCPALHAQTIPWEEVGRTIRAIAEEARAEMGAIEAELDEPVTAYVDAVSEALGSSVPGGHLDGRRLGMLRTNLLAALALARRGFRWHEDDYHLVYQVLCLSLPHAAVELEPDFTGLAGPHAAAWRTAFGGARGRPWGLRLPARSSPATEEAIEAYLEHAGELSEEEHGLFLGQVVARTAEDDLDQRVHAMTAGLRIVRRLLDRTDVPAGVVARALSWADGAAGLGSGAAADAAERLLESLSDCPEILDPQHALALRLALEAGRRGYPGSQAEIDPKQATRAWRAAWLDAFNLLEDEHDAPDASEE